MSAALKEWEKNFELILATISKKGPPGSPDEELVLRVWDEVRREMLRTKPVRRPEMLRAGPVETDQRLLEKLLARYWTDGPLPADNTNLSDAPYFIGLGVHYALEAVKTGTTADTTTDNHKDTTR